MRKLIFVIQVILLIAIIIHFTIKDYVLLSSLIFYAFPLPILILATLLLAIITNKTTRRIAIIVVLFLGIMWIKQSYVSNTIEVQKGDFEIVFWNAFHDRNFEEAFDVNGNIPDVLVLVESSSENLSALKLKYPNYHFHVSKEEIGIFSKTPLEIGEEKIGEENSSFLDFKTNGLNFYVVDISSGIFKSRKKSLDFVESNILKNDKTIVLGDFNTPYKSVHFSSLKNNYVHAFTEKGNGFRETWFWNIPLLSLDHIWVSKDLEISQVEKINTFKSDHAMLKMSLSN